MGRILAIDYGTKRIGLAVTDPSRIIATPLTTISPKEIFSFLKTYDKKETIDAFVVGMPVNLNQKATHATLPTEKFVVQLKKHFPQKKMYLHDERFTSKMALQTMIAGGAKKKDRQKKETLDKISATIILQSFMETNF